MPVRPGPLIGLLATALFLAEAFAAEPGGSLRDLEAAGEPIGEAGQGSRHLQPLLEFRRDRFLRGGDHTAFNQEGFPAVRFTEWREDFNHQR